MSTNPVAGGAPRVPAIRRLVAAAVLVAVSLPSVHGVARAAVPAVAPAVAPAVVPAVALAPAPVGPRIHGVAAPAAVAPFERFEAQFDVDTVSTRPNWPYDPAAPPGLPSGAGVSVDVLFTPDHWTTVITQPAFLNQPYTRTVVAGRDHLTPSGGPRWAVRFAPQAAGTWEYRIQVRDRSGLAVFPATGALSFAVSGASANPYVARGFLRVSSRDARYFEFSDGSPFVGVGFNEAWMWSSVDAAGQRMADLERFKVNFTRVWMSGMSMNGSHWSSWARPNQPSDGYLPETNYDTRATFEGADVSLRLDGNNRCFFADFWQGGIPVTPGATYSLTARVMVSGALGAGFTVRRGGWPDATCSGGTALTPAAVGTTGWITLSGSYAAPAGEHWMNYLYLVIGDTGSAFVDEVRLWRADDPYRVNLLREPNANSHLDFDPMNAALADLHIETAARHGVYLKLVIDEKNEWIRNRIGADGGMGERSGNDLFYASPGTKVRWLAQAWWRYLIARWGYSTAIHSFEYVNEGDPYHGGHYDAAEAMARYFRANDPSRHMVTTSFWHSFPNSQFWSNPAYPDVDYADLHAYISTGWGTTASFIDEAHRETRPEHVRSGNGAFRASGTETGSWTFTPPGVAIQGAGEWVVRFWMKAQNLASNCQRDGQVPSAGARAHLQWSIDGGWFYGGKDGWVPIGPSNLFWLCVAPAGTYGWRQFRSDRDLQGNPLPVANRLILTDTLPHEIALRVQQYDGAGGAFWIDDVELVSPSGEVVPVIGQFDITPMDEDTAWFNRAYGDLFGGRSPAGARKPLVRGETGVDQPGWQEWQRDLNKDAEGIWLHNNVWAQAGPGGMYDLMWWAEETIIRNPGAGRYTAIYTPYLTYRNFMADVPINNGLYRDAGAVTSHPDLRAWGQRDDFNGRIHLWIQNTQHTWKRVVNGPAIAPVSGTVTLPQVAAGLYAVAWWDPYRINQPVVATQTIQSAGVLQLTLPAPLARDVAAHIRRIGAPPPPRAYLPAVLR